MYNSFNFLVCLKTFIIKLGKHETRKKNSKYICSMRNVLEANRSGQKEKKRQPTGIKCRQSKY